MVKRMNDFLAGLPMTIVAGAFLLLDLIPHLTGEFGERMEVWDFLPFDPAWVTIIISGLPLLYLAVWRMIYNRGISKISSALLICIAMFFGHCHWRSVRGRRGGIYHGDRSAS